MRATALLCRLRKLHTVRLLHVDPPETGLTARSVGSLLSQRGISRVTESGARSVLFGDVTACSLYGKQSDISMSLGSLRFMGVGSLKEGNRAGQHGAKYPQGKPDGSPEKAESDARKQFLEKAKEESASNVDRAQEPFRDAVESTGEATTELEFGVKDGKNTDEAIRNASEQLFKQSTINANSSEKPIKEEDKRKYPEHQHAEFSSETWADIEEEEEVGTYSPKVDLRVRGGESVLEVGGQRGGESHTDEASASGETARENIEKTRSEMRSGKGRSPQAGVIVGNVASDGANAKENEGDIPQFHTMQKDSADETLDKAQKSYEQAISGFGTGGDKNLNDDPKETSDAKFHKA